MSIEYKQSTSLEDYDNALQAMENRVAQIIKNEAQQQLWLLEHPALYTAGTSAQQDDLLTPERFPVHYTGRGGEYTYHGPGQRIGYAILNLRHIHHDKPDLRKYVTDLEQWLINSLERLGVNGERRKDRVGIWVINQDGSEDKIAAIGVRVRKWITFHGVAINNTPTLEHFSGIIPCGIRQHGVTSLQKLGVNCSMEELDIILINEFKKIFEA